MLLVRRGRERIHVGPGEDVRIPAKVRHTFEAEVDSTYTAEFRPVAWLMRLIDSRGT